LQPYLAAVAARVPIAFVYKLPDGTRRSNLSISGKPVFDDAGTFLAIAEPSRRHRSVGTEAALAQKNAMLEGCCVHSDGIEMVSADLNVLAWNEQLFTVFDTTIVDPGGRGIATPCARHPRSRTPEHGEARQAAQMARAMLQTEQAAAASASSPMDGGWSSARADGRRRLCQCLSRHHGVEGARASRSDRRATPRRTPIGRSPIFSRR